MHICKKYITFNVLKIKLIQTFFMCKIKKSSNINSQLELFEFPDLKKSIEVSFTAPDLSSFGCLHLLHGVNLRQGFLTRLASHIMEWRNKDLIVHSLEKMLIPRVFQIAAVHARCGLCAVA